MCVGGQGKEAKGKKIQFQICGFKSGWKLNANKLLFLCVVIYRCAGAAAPEREAAY